MNSTTKIFAKLSIIFSILILFPFASKAVSFIDGLEQKLSLEGGFNKTTGNSKNENYTSNLKLISVYDEWKHTLEGKASNKKQDNTREEEYYKFSGKLDKEISEKQYVFGKLSYEDDRFAGIDYRVSELVGFGHKFYDDKDLQLSTEVGIGARQTELIGTTDDEETLLGNIGGELFWMINEHVHFNQSLSINAGSENTETTSSSSIKAFMSESLYLKVSYEVRNNSDVIASSKNTDTETLFTIGYEF